MFQVKGRDLHPRTKYDMCVYTVYTIARLTSGLTLFLVWHDSKWVWAMAAYFEPVD